MKSNREMAESLNRLLLNRACAAVVWLLLFTVHAEAQSLTDNLHLTITSPTTDTYQLSWVGQIGHRYQVQSSADFGQWFNAAPEVTGAGGLITMQDGPTSNLQKFYRVAVIGAVRPFPTTGQLSRNDDGSSSSRISLGFTVNFFGISRTSVWINNNGNITFDTSLSTFTPLPLQSSGSQMIAPFWADVDTRPAASGVTSYSSGIFVDLHKAFAVTWPHVGYYDQRFNGLNTFQVVLIERLDVGAGSFDVELNYDKVQWETGETSSSGGTDGLGGKSARVGITNGSTKSVELSGSGIPGMLLDTAPATGLIYKTLNATIPGRYLLQVRGGNVLGIIQVSAGADTTLAPGVLTTQLSGSASDPNGPLTYQWKKLTGFDGVSFSDSTVLNPTVTFPTTGV